MISKQLLYFTVSLVLITVLVWQLFTLITQPLTTKINHNYLDYAQKELVNGNVDEAKDILHHKVNQAVVDQNKFQYLSTAADKINDDLFFEYSFMLENGNQARADIIKQVIGDYDNAKEVLQTALNMWQKGETRYAKLLLKRAKTMDATYVGVKEVENYFHETNT